MGMISVAHRARLLLAAATIVASPLGAQDTVAVRPSAPADRSHELFPDPFRAHGRGPAWVAVGDSIAMELHEWVCEPNRCGFRGTPPGALTWTVDDTSVAHPIRQGRAEGTDPWTHAVPSGRSAWIAGVREGRTTVRVRRTDADPHVVRTIELLVTRPVAHVRIERVGTGPVRVSEPVRFRVRAFDSAGAEIAGVPAYYATSDSQGEASLLESDAADVFAHAGAYAVVGRLGRLTDTLHLTVAGEHPATAALRRTPATLVALVAGSRSNCLTTTAGTAWCWGFIGEERGRPYDLHDSSGGPLRLRDISTASTERCAVTTMGEVLCQSDLSGGLRDSAGAEVELPDPCLYYRCLMPLPMRGGLPAVPLRHVTNSGDHACALAEDGRAYCWGENLHGELGDGTWSRDSAPDVRAPVAVTGDLRFTQLSAGMQFTCGVSTDAAVWCWGEGDKGQVGDTTQIPFCTNDGPTPESACTTSRPHRIPTEQTSGGRRDIRLTSVHAGLRGACAVSEDGGAWCWGFGWRCRLGRCDRGESATALRIAVPGRVVEAGSGDLHACARTSEQRVFCWGDNTGGALGSHVGVDSSAKAVEVAPGRRWSALAVGQEHACALDARDGGIWCWGGGRAVVLGLDAAMIPCRNIGGRCHPTPVRVRGLPPLRAR
jgi:alpha-tubulin suppressor-like RCC1 family protein